MRTWCLVVALAAGLGLGLVAAVPMPAAEEASAEQIKKLIDQLGSDNFGAREQASKQLDEIGVPALEALRQAAQSRDAETRRRAEELVQKIERASRFNQGFATVEYLASALVDLKLHLAGDQTIDPRAFERDTLAALGMPREIVMRHRTPQFSHVFSGDGYSAGYYSYLWSDTLSADAYEAFTEAAGPYDKAVAGRLRQNVFQAGNTVDPATAYRAFRGKDPGIAALMRKRGFPVPASAKAR